MTEPILLPPGVAVGILAFLLSLLPAGLLLWVWYLRRHDRPVPTSIVFLGFFLGLLLVIPAFQLEKGAARLWETTSPATAYYFDGAILPLQTAADVILPALGTFLVVALVEEGLRYLLLLVGLRFIRSVDQVFDGLVIGLAAGLGFATLENTLYFFQLFSAGNFDTLVFVFFLRFLISTLAHISFGGIMGALMARGLFSMYQRRAFLLQAFLLPWFMHGLYDWLLGVNQTLYAAMLLLVPLLVLTVWSGRREFFVINKAKGKLLVTQQAPPVTYTHAGPQTTPAPESPWNATAPWLSVRRWRRPASKAT